MSSDRLNDGFIASQGNDEPPELRALRSGFATEDRLPELGWALNNLGADLAEAGRSAEAVTVFQEAVAVWRSLVADNPDAHLPDLADSLHNLSLTLSGDGWHHEAIDAMQQATVAYRQVGPIFHTELLESLGSLHDQLIANWQAEAALPVIGEVVDIRRTLVAEDPDRQPELADSLRRFGHCLAYTARRTEAVAALEEAIALYRVSAAAGPGDRPCLADCLHQLGGVLAELGQPVKALAVTEEAVQIQRTLPGKAGPAESLRELANRLADLSRHDEALTAIEDAIGRYTELAADQPEHYADELVQARQLRDWLPSPQARLPGGRHKEPPATDATPGSRRPGTSLPLHLDPNGAGDSGSP